MASIRDVAKKANVAACTVSRVMNGTANVAPETRQKIEDAMKELNYIPNELARGMFRQTSGTVAMLIPSIRHPNILKTNIVDGVIMGVSDLEDKEYQQFDKPMIMLDYDAGKKLPIVVSDHEKGGRLAAEKFMESQCRYVIHIGDRELSKVESYKCHTALAHALNAAGIENRFIEIKWNEFDFSGYLEIAKTILEKYPQVDGVMAADIQAAAFLKAALKLGKKIPDDFALVSYDGTYVADVNLVNVTSIIQSADKIGDKTVEVLLKLMAGQKLTKRKYLIDVVRKDGETTK